MNIVSQWQRPRWSSFNSSSNSHAQSHSGAKRGHDQRRDETRTANSNTKKTSLALPRIVDVLTVNLLCLLEGVAAIRLYHRQQRVVVHSSCSPSSCMLDKVTSMAATEVLTAIRSSVNRIRRPVLPLDVEDTATFYYTRSIRIASTSVGILAHLIRCWWYLVLLGPGAKMMLRRHLFELMNKLLLYEQV